MRSRHAIVHCPSEHSHGMLTAMVWIEHVCDLLCESWAKSKSPLKYVVSTNLLIFVNINFSTKVQAIPASRMWWPIKWTTFIICDRNDQPNPTFNWFLSVFQPEQSEEKGEKSQDHLRKGYRWSTLYFPPAVVQVSTADSVIGQYNAESNNEVWNQIVRWNLQIFCSDRSFWSYHALMPQCHSYIGAFLFGRAYPHIPRCPCSLFQHFKQHSGNL